MKSNILKDKRAWWLSHEAFLLLQELAHQQGLQTAAFLEVISREHVFRLSGQANRCITFTQGLCIGGKGMDIDHWITEALSACNRRYPTWSIAYTDVSSQLHMDKDIEAASCLSSFDLKSAFLQVLITICHYLLYLRI